MPWAALLQQSAAFMCENQFPITISKHWDLNPKHQHTHTHAHTHTRAHTHTFTRPTTIVARTTRTKLREWSRPPQDEVFILIFGTQSYIVSALGSCPCFGWLVDQGKKKTKPRWSSEAVGCSHQTMLLILVIKARRPWWCWWQPSCRANQFAWSQGWYTFDCQ